MVSRANAAASSPYPQTAPEPMRTESFDTDRAGLYAEDRHPDLIVTSAPERGFQLGYFDVMCLVWNRMIGTGIFMSPQRVMQGTRSTGPALLLWLVGILYCLAGTHVYIEYGLNVPRYVIHGVEQSVPRSGGDLNYLQYVYRKPAYRKNTVLLITSLFGVSFILLGNMAGNSIQFGTSVLQAAGHETPSNGAVRAIAIASALFACFIHAFSRRGGILLNNLLAVVKVGILLLIIATAGAVAAGAFGPGKNVSAANMAAAHSFRNARQGDSYGYVRAFLAIVFTFSGFEQPNYVLGEVARPRTKLPVAMAVGVGVVVTLYMLVNIAYMVVVPSDMQAEGVVALGFFELTYGQLSDSPVGKRIFNAFLAVSSLGNVIVMTYTAARVKQEIAKEGILPSAKFFAQNTDLSLGRLLRWLRARGLFARLLRLKSLGPEHHSERTPVGAIVLHFCVCLVPILATYNVHPDQAYTLITSMTAYVVNCFFGAFLGLGILILRFRGAPPTSSDSETNSDSPSDSESAPPPASRASWRAYAGPRSSHWLSIACAAFFTLANLYPIFAAWVPPTAGYYYHYYYNHASSDGAATSPPPWYVVPVVSWCVIALGGLWWLGFLWIAKRQDRLNQQVFVVEKKPEFETAGGTDGEDHQSRDGLVLVHETVYLSWVGKESLRQRLVYDDERDERSRQFAGTDFDGYHGS